MIGFQCQKCGFEDINIVELKMQNNNLGFLCSQCHNDWFPIARLVETRFQNETFREFKKFITGHEA